jgi:hypothetical protein
MNLFHVAQREANIYALAPVGDGCSYGSTRE